jgi:two-component system, OmpR family, response regulator
MNQNNSILIVEDDEEIKDLVVTYLEKNSYQVSSASKYADMKILMKNNHYDLMLLDVNLPDADGLNICREVRASSQIPIIMMTAKSDEIDKILGLEMGADDYITKPFSSREMLARIRANIRRTMIGEENLKRQSSQSYFFSGWRLDLLTRQLHSPENVATPITGGEFDLLHALCEYPNRLLTRDQIILMTQGLQSESFARSVDILISRLRVKLNDEPKISKFIRTVRGEGYVFLPKVTSHE